MCLPGDLTMLTAEPIFGNGMIMGIETILLLIVGTLD